MFDPVLLRSLTGTPLRVRCAVLPVPAPGGGAAHARHEWSVLRVTLRGAGSTGRGEATLLPYLEAHRPEALGAQLASAEAGLAHMISPVQLPDLLPPGPLRSALDTALWDLLAKRSGQRAWELLGVPRPRPVPAIRTLPLLGHATLEEELHHSDGFASLKLKLGAGAVEDDLARLDAVRRHRPDAWLMADAGGGWDVDRLRTMLPKLADHGVRVLEQPLPEAQSGALAALRRPFPIIADPHRGEAADLGRLVSRYDGINLKLDAVGGLTTALGMMEQAEQRGLLVLLGSPPATARSWAATLHAAPRAHLVNLPQELRVPGEPGEPRRTGGTLAPPSADLWG
ncbi:L-Ala-D/L-Glu epimerase [Streptomyces lucensis JCM 4490]|uniref:L-Ala-D/L-Glu epimerase n=1 Tax=Streptomyces lucensis JCM 4490 TaxID=1306176 RepID=A0A918MUT8_9ACTN|nr:enolase C-terminal domain-like protein [Streptomyces lucensis]GGW69682.1 L-Ala-D/L-Glu epimerase [Streptomyces lucensis JCM 4490]